MKTIQVSVAAMMAGAFACASPAGADVLYSNFGPGDSFLGNAGWSVANGGPFGAHVEESVSFIVPGQNYRLDSVHIAIGHLFGPNVLYATLHADSGIGGGSPGAVLESITVIDQMMTLPTDPGINNPPVVLEFSGSTVLDQGARYWISVSTDATTDSWAAWNENTTGDTGLRAYRQDGGAWNTFNGHARGAFRVNATLVPAPASLLCMLGGVGAVANRRCRRPSPRTLPAL